MFFYIKLTAEVIPFDMSYLTSLQFNNTNLFERQISSRVSLVKAFGAEMFMATSIVTLLIWFLFTNKEVEETFYTLKHYAIRVLLLTFILT